MSFLSICLSVFWQEVTFIIRVFLLAFLVSVCLVTIFQAESYEVSWNAAAAYMRMKRSGRPSKRRVVGENFINVIIACFASTDERNAEKYDVRLPYMLASSYEESRALPDTLQNIKKSKINIFSSF